jgi:hypothetical protein
MLSFKMSCRQRLRFFAKICRGVAENDGAIGASAISSERTCRTQSIMPMS